MFTAAGSQRDRPRIGAVMGLFIVVPLLAAAGEQPPVADRWRAPAEACALLDDVGLRNRMDGLLFKLAVLCGRSDLLGGAIPDVAVEPDVAATEAGGVDIPVNDPSGDVGSYSHTQSETSIARNEVTGNICSGYNDSWHYVTGNGLTGFSRSTDGGATFSDRGALGAGSWGDPSLVWRRSDGHFYFAALETGGIGLWRSTNDCLTFSLHAAIHSNSYLLDDKEIMTVDNNPTSPYYGRLYVQWTDFGAGGRVFSSHSSDGGSSWSAPLAVSAAGAVVIGAWPVVAPSGHVFAAWVRDFDSGPIDIEVVRSTNGGASFTQVTNPVTDKPIPRDASATNYCSRPALRGNIRYYSLPQIAVGPDGVLHVVYSYDPDGLDIGDVIDVFYRRSTNSGSTWGPEVRLNTDATTNDQAFPALSVGSANIVSVGWYDRRDDPSNTLFKYYQRFSYDGGLSWEPDRVLSDVAAPTYLDPEMAACYHSDYDTHIQTETELVAQWSDDRNVQTGHNDPDVWADRLPISNDFLILPDVSSLEVCAPAVAVVTINVPQISGFSELVTLATGALPPGVVADFDPNPVTPPGSSDLTLSAGGAVTPGSYDILVTGTSSPSGIVHDATIRMGVYSSPPGEPALVEPPDGAVNQQLRPVFVWAAASQAALYTLEVDDDPSFSSPELLETGIAGTSFAPSSDLASSTIYYWRVAAVNACGAGAISSVFTFSTEALPGDCDAGMVPVFSLSENFESGAPGWIHNGLGDTWALSGARVHSGASSYHATDVYFQSDQRLESPDIPLPVGAPVTLRFWNWQTIEPFGDDCMDGGIFEISTDGGGTWTYLPTELMLTDPYDGPIAALPGREGWCAEGQDWLQSVVDLDAYAGQTARVRFRLVTGSWGEREGWYVDDLHVQSCVPDIPGLPFEDGFESGDTSAWSATVP